MCSPVFSPENYRRHECPHLASRTLALTTGLARHHWDIGDGKLLVWDLVLWDLVLWDLVLVVVVVVVVVFACGWLFVLLWRLFWSVCEVMRRAFMSASVLPPWPPPAAP